MKPEFMPHAWSGTRIQIYQRDIRKTPLLTRREEQILGGRIAAGDVAARDRLVRANLRLVVSLARRSMGRGLSLEDLISEGNLGLMRAAEGFEAKTNARFCTYTSCWIKQSIRHGVINQGRSLRVPMYLVSLMSKWRRATAVLNDRFGRVPSTEEVGKALGLSRMRLGGVTHAIDPEDVNLLRTLE
jgi:RNA polymerase primary sigma factor